MLQGNSWKQLQPQLVRVHLLRQGIVLVVKRGVIPTTDEFSKMELLGVVVGYCLKIVQLWFLLQ